MWQRYEIICNYKAAHSILTIFISATWIVEQQEVIVVRAARPRDHETAGPRDCGTAGPRDCETTRLRETLEKHRHSQAFSVVLSCAEPCEAAWRQSGADVVPSRSLAGWGCTWAYIPIQTNELGAADVPLSRQELGVRRVPSATLGKNAVDG